MDKFLMSSPAQLSQPFDVGSGSSSTKHHSNHNNNSSLSHDSDNSAILHLSNVDMFESGDGHDVLLPPDLLNSAQSLKTTDDLSLDEDSHDFDHDELVVPVSTNNPSNKQANSSSFYLADTDFDSVSQYDTTLTTSAATHNLQQYSQQQFVNSRNLYLDDGYGSQMNLGAGFQHNHSNTHNHQYQSQPRISNHQQNLSISSNFSVSQEPPSQHIPQSNSTNTLYSVESIPQLSSSVSNQSLSDSPSSLPQPVSQQQQQQSQQSQQPYQQFNNAKQQIMATPRKGGRKKSLSVSSTTNLYSTPMRFPTGAMSPVNLANPSQTSKVGKTPYSSKAKGHSRSRSKMSLDASANLALATRSASIQNLNNLNPFYTPSSYISPHPNHNNHNNNIDLDDIGTPLLTPNHLRNNSSMTTQNNSTYFSPINSHTNTNSTSTHINSTGLPFILKRHDTLDSIKIEDQDDDALKQLKKAKSYSSISYASRRASTKDKSGGNNGNGNGNNGNNYLNEGTDISELSLNIQIPTQQELQQAGIDEASLYSSNSTPGIFYSQNSPSVTFGQPLTINQASIKSSTAPASAHEYDSNIFKPSKGIDLLSPSIITSGNDNIINPKHSSNSHHSSFTKSYPASIDLASIATSPMNDNGNGNQGTTNNNLGMTESSRVSRTSSTASSQIYSSGMTPLTHTTTNNSVGGLLPPIANYSAIPQQEYYNNYSMSLAANVMTGASTMSPNDSSSGLSANSNLDRLIPTNSMKAVKPKSKKPEREIDLAKEAKKKHKCPVCDSKFQRPEHVKRHLKSHSTDKPFQCDEPNCGKRFNRKDNLKAHLKKIHQRTTFNI
ncbi:uncharacterized protein RJT21DRAFT_139217 [Scheffersomyces amazonensis]|uniref:uncharacterized protein n=1 Tax=Scheffersomyces amazonensis TaxID=1078765 RepID=UPI00315CD0CB